MSATRYTHGVIINWVGRGPRNYLDAATIALLPHLPTFNRDVPLWEIREAIEFGEVYAWQSRDKAIAAARAMGQAFRQFRDRVKVKLHVVGEVY